nr:isocitrate lyase/phosphoenolpyruvate mutase family protein [uncultured Actinoplanes sp.]
MSPTFAELHRGELPLLLPNAWDVPSALALAAEGYPAIGTTSFGVSLATGRPDGQRASRDANLALAASLAGRGFFLSVDIEDGYSDDPREVAAYAERLTADGINIEDSTDEELIDPEAHAAKITAIKQRRPELFVNARVDTYWLGQKATVPETVRRAQRYIEAGADGIFVPGADDPGALTVDVPLNVLATPGMTLRQLGELGVRRVSTGSLPYRAAFRAAVDAVNAVREGKAPPPAMPYGDLQRLMR